ncbi:MAG: radical SAM protein [Clostridia bacterium]|nr:radical SAM protein [Clostridia bacterium]
MIIPIFIPHEGCPNDCAFCNQRTISGKSSAPSLDDARLIIEQYLENGTKKADQIAFFGGSFTGISALKQNEYLSLANEYIKKGLVGSIRLSTRPDYISEDTVKRLISFGVKNIELGAQSMDEEVLRASNRGHSGYDVEKASEIILKCGAILGLQMMTGLPLDNMEKCLYTAQRFCELGAKESRIYPTVVLRGTKLAQMYADGEYTPQSVEEAVAVSARVYRLFKESGITVLRIGLPDSAELRENYIAGAYHPSLGELVMSRDIRNRIEESLCGKKEAEIRVNPKFISKVNGNKRCNIEYFKNKGIKIAILEDSSVDEYAIKKEP